MIAIVGAGPAGLSAAAAAAQRGERVVLIDSSPRLGGQYWRHLPSVWNDNRSSHYNFSKAQELFDLVLNNPLITRYSSAYVWQAEKKNGIFRLYVVKDGIEEVVEAEKVILATGAYDRSIPFPGWTLPGSMTPGAAQAMVKSHGVLVGRKVVIAGTGPFILPVATNLAEAGADIAGLFEANYPWRWILNLHGLLLNPSKIREALYYMRKLRKLGIKIEYGKRVESASRNSVRVNGEEISCDVVAVGWGFVPELSLAGILGAAMKVLKDGTVVVAVNSKQETSVPGLYAAGESTGIGGSTLAALEGKIAGGGRATFARWRAQIFASGLMRVYPVPSDLLRNLSTETIICRCEEVSVGDLYAACDNLGAENGRTAKLFSRAGMGLCQGRVCGRNVSEIVAGHTHQDVQDSERIAATSRPIAAPISLGELGDGIEKQL
jgi:NADPH-dependent 2,4-dienoyl-CoA reductase/sulfur reductase-like enzyme